MGTPGRAVSLFEAAFEGSTDEGGTQPARSLPASRTRLATGCPQGVQPCNLGTNSLESALPLPPHEIPCGPFSGTAEDAVDYGKTDSKTGFNALSAEEKEGAPVFGPGSPMGKQDPPLPGGARHEVAGQGNLQGLPKDLRNRCKASRTDSPACTQAAREHDVPGNGPNPSSALPDPIPDGRDRLAAREDRALRLCTDVDHRGRNPGTRQSLAFATRGQT